MKTLEEIINQETVYLHNWSCKVDLIGDFEEIYMSGKEYYAQTCPYANTKMWLEHKEKMRKAIEKYKDITILFASYGTDNYEGDAFVLFHQDGKLYEVNGGHCSCYGLEGQWEPEETSLEALRHRLIEGRLGEDDYSGNVFKSDLMEFLGIK